MIKTLLFLILSTKLAWSEMVSLKDYHAANPYLGKDEIYYVSNRCSALMYHLFSLQQTPTDLKEFLKNSQKEFTSLSLLIKQNNDPSLSDEVYLNETSEKIDLAKKNSDIAAKDLCYEKESERLLNLIQGTSLRSENVDCEE